MDKLDLFKGMTLNDEEMFVIHGESCKIYFLLQSLINKNELCR